MKNSFENFPVDFIKVKKDLGDNFPLVALGFISIFALLSFDWQPHDESNFIHHEVNYSNPDVAFFGKPTAAIDWCEDNYAVSPYIAEFWNTISSTTLFFMGVLGTYLTIITKQETRFLFNYVTLAIVGAGSVLFHCTMHYKWQLADEIPMLYGLEAWLYVLIHHENVGKVSKWWAFGLVAYGGSLTLFFTMATTDYPVIHQLHILGGVAFGLKKLIHIVKELRQENHDYATRVFKFYVFFGLLGFGCWIVDKALCSPLNSLPLGMPNPQLHAYWHVCMALHCYLGPVVVMYSRALKLKMKPKISLLPLNLPFVEVINEKKS